MLPAMTRPRPRVALVTCAAFPDLYVDDRLLLPALERLGIEPVPAIWSDDAVDWSSFDALLIRSPWDYFERHAEFRAWLAKNQGGSSSSMLADLDKLIAADMALQNQELGYSIATTSALIK